VTRGQLPQRTGSLGLNGGGTAAAVPPKFQPFRQLTPSSFRSIPTLPSTNNNVVQVYDEFSKFQKNCQIQVTAHKAIGKKTIQLSNMNTTVVTSLLDSDSTDISRMCVLHPWYDGQI